MGRLRIGAQLHGHSRGIAHNPTTDAIFIDGSLTGGTIARSAAGFAVRKFFYLRCYCTISLSRESTRKTAAD
jgi:hypothetical protein